MDGQRVTAEAMPHYLPGEPLSLPPRPPMQDVVVQLFSYQDLAEPILVPAVVEPLLVLVLSGAATVEERALRDALAGAERRPFRSDAPVSRAAADRAGGA